jgi:protein gp37
MGKTAIEWTEKVWNPVTGCTKTSPGCAHCYAERMAKRLAGRCGYPKDEPFRVTWHPVRMDEPLRWRKPSMVFVCSMGDLFHEDVPDMAIINILAVIAEAKQHTFMILTKRPERALGLFSLFVSPTIPNDVWLQTSRGITAEKAPWPLPNLWLGVTAENQEMADKRIPILLQIPAAVRFVSVEPMLGPVDLCNLPFPPVTTSRILDALRAGSKSSKPWGLDWVICGGESGPGARPLHPDWARSLRDQCVASGTPFFFKQWGEWAPATSDYGVTGGLMPGDGSRFTWIGRDGKTQNPSSHGLMDPVMAIARVGKHVAGRLLDGRTWDEMPGKERSL